MDTFKQCEVENDFDVTILDKGMEVVADILKK
jgi:hypothetical protein